MTLDQRYESHVERASRAPHGRRKAWHIAAAIGLYRMLADRELAGGAPAPMGLPHLLTLTPAELSAMIGAFKHVNR